MGKAHFLLFGDRVVVDRAVHLILQHDPLIELVSTKTLECEDINETTDVFKLRRGSEVATVAIIVGDRSSKIGPYDDDYWIYIDGEPRSLFDYNRPFALHLVQLLISGGARETRP